jgi:hypothetical protein
VVSLCCCDQAVAGTKIRFGFARHRRWGFIPRYALPATWGSVWFSIFAAPTWRFPDYAGFQPAFDALSRHDVYTDLIINESVVGGPIPYSAQWHGRLNRRGGGFVMVNQANATFDGFSLGPLTNNFHVTQFRAARNISGQPPEDYQQTLVLDGTVFDFTDTWETRDYGVVTRRHTRTLGNLVTTEQLAGDVRDLLDAIDLRTITDLPVEGPQSRLAQFDQNGDIQIMALSGDAGGVLLPLSKLSDGDPTTPARNQSGLFFPTLINPAVASFGVFGAQAAVWAGWTLNPPDVEPESINNSGTGITTQKRYLDAADTRGFSDRFEVLGGKCLVASPSRPFYARQTESKLKARMGADSCVNLRPEIGTRTQFLLGATAADRARHPGVLSLRPWEDHEGGQFIQVSDTPC